MNKRRNHFGIWCSAPALFAACFFSDSLFAAPPVVVEDYSTTVQSAPSSSYGRSTVSHQSRSLMERIDSLEQRVDSEKTLGLVERIDTLERELSELRGQMEVQAHQFQLMQNKQNTAPQMTGPQMTSMSQQMTGAPQQMTSTSQQITGVSQSASSTVSSPSISSASLPPASVNTGMFPPSAQSTQIPPVAQPAAAPVRTDDFQGRNEIPTDPEQLIAEQKLYMVAYDHLKTKDYPSAIDALEAYLDEYPTGRYAVHAHYWMGEVYFIQSQLDLAHEQFTWIIENAPEDQKAGDALLKVGLIQASQKKLQDAKQTLSSVKTRYPGTMIARLADARLAELKQEKLPAATE